MHARALCHAVIAASIHICLCFLLLLTHVLVFFFSPTPGMGVLTPVELQARTHVMYETFLKRLHIEGSSLLSMLNTLILPTAITFQERLARSYNAAAKVCVLIYTCCVWECCGCGRYVCMLHRKHLARKGMYMYLLCGVVADVRVNVLCG